LSRETYLSYEDRHINDIYSITKSSCKTGKSYRRVAFELTREEFKEIIGKNCHYCGVGPSNYRKTPGRDYVFKYNGVDRIDCSIGYLSTNVVPCCKRCNAAKNNQTVAEFREWLERAARFQQLI
jgi:5-methylcytosine-specific restriction endonuclease McrA